MEGKWDILPKVRHEANVKCGTFIDATPLFLRVLEWGARADTLLLYYMYVCPDLHIKGNFSSAKKMQFSHISLCIAMLLAPFSRGRNAGQRESDLASGAHSSDQRRRERREIVFATPNSVAGGRAPSLHPIKTRGTSNKRGKREREKREIEGTPNNGTPDRPTRRDLSS